MFRPLNTPPYALNWGNRAGFAKYALENGYDIIPVSSVGFEEIV